MLLYGDVPGCRFRDFTSKDTYIEYDNIYLGRDVVDCDGDTWIEIVGELPASALFAE